MKRKNSLYLLGAAVILLFAACQGCSGIATGFTKVANVITQPTARELYLREIKDSQPILQSWKSAYENAINDSLTVSLPYGEKGTFNPNRIVAYSYDITFEEGEKLVAEVVADTTSRIFIDVFEADSNKSVASNENGQSAMEFTPLVSGVYKIIIQPGAAAQGDFFISLNKRPAYGFPVSGKGNSAIGSFWGVDRDGGQRRHEGIDIFAKKGTPVVAITDGTVTYSGEKGIGGKQVWLRDGLFGKSLYYAHLDRSAVEQGDRVKSGDTLGYVGNTGNAKFTPAHLHFGIYTMGYAINPLPYVYVIQPVSQKQFPRNFKSATIKVKGTANLRQGPGTDMPVIGSVVNEQVTLLGQHKDWLHIQTAGNKKAFIHKSLVKG